AGRLRLGDVEIVRLRAAGRLGTVLDHIPEPLVEVRRAEREAAVEERPFQAGLPAPGLFGLERGVPDHVAAPVRLCDLRLLERGAERGPDAGRAVRPRRAGADRKSVVQGKGGASGEWRVG